MAELSELLNLKSSRTKRRRIRDNVEKAIFEISSGDSTYFDTPVDGNGQTEQVEYENVIGIYDTISEQCLVGP